MTEKKIKLTIEVTTVDIPKKGGSLCNPAFGKAKVNFHYFGGESISVVTSGLPNYPVEIIAGIEELKLANDFFIKIIEGRRKK